MAALCWNATGAAQVKPDPVDTAGLVRSDDYPIEAIAAGQSGPVAMTVSIDETGRVLSCTIKQSAGKALDATSCRAVQTRQFAATSKRLGGRAATIEVKLDWMLREDTQPSLELAPFGSRAIHSLDRGKVLSCREAARPGPIMLAEICKATAAQAPDIAARFGEARSLVFDLSGVQGDRSSDVDAGEKPGQTLVWREVTVLTINPMGVITECQMVEAARPPVEQERECAQTIRYQRYKPLPEGAGDRFLTYVKVAYVTLEPEED